MWRKKQKTFNTDKNINNDVKNCLKLLLNQYLPTKLPRIQLINISTWPCFEKTCWRTFALPRSLRVRTVIRQTWCFYKGVLGTSVCLSAQRARWRGRGSRSCQHLDQSDVLAGTSSRLPNGARRLIRCARATSQWRASIRLPRVIKASREQSRSSFFLKKSLLCGFFPLSFRSLERQNYHPVMTKRWHRLS